MFPRCYRCFRPIGNCLCPGIVPISSGVKFVFLMHPKEAYRQKTGTGRLAALSLAESEIIVGTDFTRNERLNELISGAGDGTGFFPVVLYPSDDAWFTDSPPFRAALGTKKLMVILIDATWFFARKMIKLSENLHPLPKLSFKNAYRSQFEFKRQPAPECLSTIETAYYLLEELKATGLAAPETDASGLMATFRRMVGYQLTREQNRRESGQGERATYSNTSEERNVSYADSASRAAF